MDVASATEKARGKVATALEAVSKAVLSGSKQTSAAVGKKLRTSSSPSKAFGLRSMATGEEGATTTGIEGNAATSAASGWYKLGMEVLELWVAEEKLHRFRAEWVVIVEHPTVGELLVVVESIGVPLQTQLPLSMQRGRFAPSGLLVRLPVSALPEALRETISADSLRGGGPLAGPYSIWALNRRSFRSVIGWVYNLCVLIYASFFLLYVILVKFAEAGEAWSNAVANSFVISMVLSFCVTDFLVACLLALLPVRSSKSKGPLSALMDILSDI